MARVRVFEAANEGLRLIRREPKAVLAWSLVSYLIMGAPMILMMNRMAVLTGQPDGAAVESGMPASFVGFLALMPLVWLGMLLGYTLVGGAVLRAVLTPHDRRLFYLRLSKAELWMALSAVVGAVLAYIVFSVAAVALVFTVVTPLVFVVARAATDTPSAFIALAPLLLLLVIYPAALYLGVRFGMGPLMSFDERRFRLFESWALTRGSGWRLVGLWLLLAVLILAVEIVFLLLLVVAGGPNVFAAVGDPTAAQSFAEGVWDFYASPWIWLASAVGAILAGPLIAIMIAPWARAYLMLKTEPGPVVERPGA